MKIKKNIAILASVAMIASLTGCNKESEVANDPVVPDNVNEVASTPSTEMDTQETVSIEEIIPKETVTLEVYDQLANCSGEQAGWFAKVMKDRFNVKLHIYDNSEGEYDSRVESENFGDIVIWGSDGDQYHSAIKRELLLDWNKDDLLDEYGSYIKEKMPYALEKNTIISGGTTYGFGYDVAVDSNDPTDIMYTWDLRWDLYRELGYPVIDDLNDMVEVLADMKKICPKDDNGKPTYGVSLFDTWDGDMVMFVKSTASAYYGYDEFGVGLYDPVEQKFYPCLQSDGPYLKCLKFYNKLYQRGLLDPDSRTQGFEEMTKDYQNGTAFLNIFNFLGSANYNSEKHTQEGKMMAPCPPKLAQPIMYGQNVYGGNRVWSIGSKTKYPELCMAIINWLSTPEGRMTMEYGPKDVCWYYDENGKTCFTELGKSARFDGKTKMNNGYSGTFEEGEFMMNNTTWGLDAPNPDSNGDLYNYQKWDSFSSDPNSEIEADWRTYNNCTTFNSLFEKWNYRLSPGTMYSQSEKSEELNVIWNQVASCITKNSWKAIYAENDKEFDSIVAEMTAQAEEYGYLQCVKYQENEAKKRAAAENEIR